MPLVHKIDCRQCFSELYNTGDLENLVKVTKLSQISICASMGETSPTIHKKQCRQTAVPTPTGSIPKIVLSDPGPLIL